MHVLAIRSWNDRLDHLISHGDFAGALTLACEFHSDLGRALVGLRGPRDKRKGIVAKKILETLHKFLDVAMTSAFPAEGDIHVLADYFQVRKGEKLSHMRILESHLTRVKTCVCSITY